MEQITYNHKKRYKVRFSELMQFITAKNRSKSFGIYFAVYLSPWVFLAVAYIYYKLYSLGKDTMTEIILIVMIIFFLCALIFPGMVFAALIAENVYIKRFEPGVVITLEEEKLLLEFNDRKEEYLYADTSVVETKRIIFISTVPIFKDEIGLKAVEELQGIAKKSCKYIDMTTE